MAYIEGVDHKLGDRDDVGLTRLRCKLWHDYLDILRHEDLFWYQQARMDWLKFGDRNTKFFYVSIVVQRWNKSIYG